MVGFSGLVTSPDATFCWRIFTDVVRCWTTFIHLRSSVSHQYLGGQSIPHRRDAQPRQSTGPAQIAAPGVSFCIGHRDNLDLSLSLFNHDEGGE